MKVAEVTTFPWYSVGKIASSIKSYLESNGSICRFYFARGDRNEVGFFKFANNIDVYSSALLARVFDNDGFCLSLSTSRLIRYLDEFKPDIVHLHTPHGYYLNLTTLFNYLNSKRIKVVRTMHDAWAMTGHCAFFGDGNCANWRIMGCKYCKFKHEYPKSVLFCNSRSNFEKKRQLYDSCNKENFYIVSPSKWLDSYINKGILSGFNHRVIYNGIDTSMFYDFKSNREKILLCVASVWDKRKNLAKILEISSHLKTWKVIVIGKIPDKINKEAFKNIKFYDRTTSSNELVKLYNSSSLFFNPTLSDNLPTVNIEAQLCGLPVFCYDVGGNYETNCGKLKIIDKKAFIDDDFLDKISEELMSQPLTNKYLFEQDYMSQKYFELFNEIIAKK